jgi:hypothetical protein
VVMPIRSTRGQIVLGWIRLLKNMDLDVWRLDCNNY